MALNFKVRQIVQVQPSYIATIQAQPYYPEQSTIVNALQSITANASYRVYSIGNVNRAPLTPNYSYIQVLPLNVNDLSYNLGNGITVYFTNDTDLNNSFIQDPSYMRVGYCNCYNNSGSGINRASTVVLTGISSTYNAPLIAAGSTAVLGQAIDSIPNNTYGLVFITGNYQLVQNYVVWNS
jgi:hypothetical protein